MQGQPATNNDGVPALDMSPEAKAARRERWRKRSAHIAKLQEEAYPPNHPIRQRGQNGHVGYKGGFDCKHLGAETGETIICPTCSGKVELKLFACAVFTECTTHKKADSTACCGGAGGVGCAHFEPKPKMIEGPKVPFAPSDGSANWLPSSGNIEWDAADWAEWNER